MRSFTRDPPKPKSDFSYGIKAVPKEATAVKLNFLAKKKNAQVTIDDQFSKLTLAEYTNLNNLIFPYEIWEYIFNYLIDDEINEILEKYTTSKNISGKELKRVARRIVSINLTCTTFYAIISEGMLNTWKYLAYIRWPHLQAISMNIKSWYKFIIQRSLVYDKTKPQDLFIAPIENCALLGEDTTKWEFKCPKSYSDLDQVGDDQKYCTTCNKYVYLIKSVEDYISHIQQGHCIAYYERITDSPVESSYNRFPLFEYGSEDTTQKRRLFGIDVPPRQVFRIGSKWF